MSRQLLAMALAPLVGLFWAFGSLSLFFTPTTPMTATGAELVVTEELMQGALAHEYLEDLSDAVWDVDAAEPVVGPPAADESHIAYYDDVDQG